MYNLSDLIPSKVARTVKDIDFKALATNGPINVLIDLDGTLAATLSEEYEQQMIDHLLAARKSGFIANICVFSNTGLPFFVPRVRRIAKRLNAEYVACYWPYTMKPSRAAFQKALDKVGGTIYNTVMIGDQLYKDILGANLIGMRSILVKTILPIPSWKRKTHERDEMLYEKLGIKF